MQNCSSYLSSTKFVKSGAFPIGLVEPLTVPTGLHHGFGELRISLLLQSAEESLLVSPKRNSKVCFRIQTVIFVQKFYISSIYRCFLKIIANHYKWQGSFFPFLDQAKKYPFSLVGFMFQGISQECLFSRTQVWSQHSCQIANNCLYFQHQVFEGKTNMI